MERTGWLPRAGAPALIWLGLVVLGGAANAGDTLVVVPNTAAASEGDGGNIYPFELDITPSMRYQQVFDAAEFEALPEAAPLVEIAFRPDAENGDAFEATISNIQINFSTTDRAPDQLSETFADNVGPDDAVVYSGSLPLANAFSGPMEGPKAFDVVIRLDTPFLFDPEAGNLLLEVRNLAPGEHTTSFDAVRVDDDAVSRVWSSPSTGSANSAMGFENTTGLVARFRFVPEPTIRALHGAALVSLALLAYGCRRRSASESCIQSLPTPAMRPTGITRSTSWWWEPAP